MDQQKRRATPTPSELRIWRDYIETAEALRARMADRMQQASALSLGDYSVLLALSEAPGHRLRPSEIATQIEWERSRVSHHLGRMEKRDLVHRAACADDSRGSDVILTEVGADAFRRSSIPHMRDIHELFIDALSAEQLSATSHLTATIRAHLERFTTTDSSLPPR